MARSGLTLPSQEDRRRQPIVRLMRRAPVLGRLSLRPNQAGPPRKHRRPRHAVALSREEQRAPKAWLIALILGSLFVHALLVLAIIFVGLHTPKWSEPVKTDKPPEVSIVLAPPPPPAQKPSFFPTEPQQNTPPQKAPLISDNDNLLKSRNRVSRDQNSPMPDVTGQHNHSLDLHAQASSPLVKSNPSPPTPPQPKQQPKEQQKTAQQKPNKATKPAPEDPNAIHPTDNPEKGDAVTKVKPPDQQFDPNGLPVLPAISAPTIAPQVTQTQPTPQTQRAAPPRSAPSFAVHQSDVSGQSGAVGDNSPAAMATDLGRYKAKVYRAVGARWYSKVNDQIGVIGVGTVHISYTIYSDGHMIITADPDGGNPSMMILHSISLNSMNEAAPFDAFSDAMKKQVGDSYSDDFSFTIYGN
jgi:outer membrane biosynthesis protein TonB